VGAPGRSVGENTTHTKKGVLMEYFWIGYYGTLGVIWAWFLLSVIFTVVVLGIGFLVTCVFKELR